MLLLGEVGAEATKVEKVKLVARALRVEAAHSQQVLVELVMVALVLPDREMLAVMQAALMAEQGADRSALKAEIETEPQVEMALTAQQIILQNSVLLF